jgi:hypothetical protein
MDSVSFFEVLRAKKWASEGVFRVVYFICDGGAPGRAHEAGRGGPSKRRAWGLNTGLGVFLSSKNGLCVIF